MATIIVQVYNAVLCGVSSSVFTTHIININDHWSSLTWQVDSIHCFREFFFWIYLFTLCESEWTFALYAYMVNNNNNLIEPLVPSITAPVHIKSHQTDLKFELLYYHNKRSCPCPAWSEPVLFYKKKRPAFCLINQRMLLSCLLSYILVYVCLNVCMLIWFLFVSVDSCP